VSDITSQTFLWKRKAVPQDMKFGNAVNRASGNNKGKAEMLINDLPSADLVEASIVRNATEKVTLKSGKLLSVSMTAMLPLSVAMRR
jgi:hypothetical protein